MAETDIYGEESPTRNSERESLREVKWAVAKSLLDANAHSTQAFEYHLLQTYHPQHSSNWDSMQECLRQAIHSHEKIVEELEFALEAVEELKDDERA